MQPTRRLQLILICSVCALFYLAAALSRNGIVNHGAATAILAAACLLVLFALLFIARGTGATSPRTPAAPRRKPLLVSAFVLGIFLIELTQLASLPQWARATAGLCGAALVLLAIVSMRRARPPAPHPSPRNRR